MEPRLAFLNLDGRWRQTCVGCSLKLEEMGLVRRISEFLPEAVIFEMMPTVTIEQCREAIDHRHVGPAWGH